MKKADELTIIEEQIMDALQHLTTRQFALVQGIAKGLSKRQSALLAGYSPRSIDSVAYETLRIPRVKDAISKILQARAYGLTRDILFKRHVELLDATKLVSSDNNQIIVPDNHIRLQAVELGYKALGVLKEDESTIPVETYEQKIAKYRPQFADEVLISDHVVTDKDQEVA